MVLRSFFDSPRYSTGYTSLFNTIGFVETHMLKKICRSCESNLWIYAGNDGLQDAHFKNKNLRLQNESQYAPGQPYTTKWELTPQKAHF
jgi:hypothetical protein